ncbi:MAG: hypothetical protein K2N01_11835 [Lachnospiraceae bacterium]|nr:hypothetical protein [Lachnospiraceae bacterium]
MREKQWVIYLQYQNKEGDKINMTEKDQLWYLINGVLNGSYDIKTFCLEFTRIYDLEVDYEQLTEQENHEFGDLCEMAGRFSDDEEELKIPNMYYSKQNILDKARCVKQKLEKDRIKM